MVLSFFNTVLMMTLLAAVEVIFVRGQAQSCSSWLEVNQRSTTPLKNVCRIDTDAGQSRPVIGAVLSLHSAYDRGSGECPSTSLKTKEAAEETEGFLLALRLATARSTNSTVTNLYDYSESAANGSLFGSTVRDTCSSESLGIEQTLDLTSSFPSSQPIAPSSGEANNCSQAQPLLAVVGLRSSQETARLSPILSALKVPHISHWASGRTFDDTTTYPYLFRMAPSNFHQAELLGSLVRTFGWTYIAAFASSDALYGSDALIGLQYHATLDPVRKFCFGVVASFSLLDVTFPYTAKMRNNIELLRNESRIKVIVLIALHDHARAFLSLLKVAGITDRVIIGSDDWIGRIDFSQYSPDTNPPPFTSLIGVAPAALLEDTWETKLRSRLCLANLSSQDTFQNLFLQTFVEESLRCQVGSHSVCNLRNATQPRMCTSEEILTLSEKEAPSLITASLVMMSVDVVINAITDVWRLRNFSRCLYPTAEEIVCALKGMQRPCPSDKTKLCPLFDQWQARVPYYHIYNMQWSRKQRGALVRIGSWSKVNQALLRPENNAQIIWNLTANSTLSPLFAAAAWPRSTCSEVCRPGQHRRLASAITLHCCFDCVDCPTYQISNGTNSPTCFECSPGFLPDTQRSSCIPVTKTYLGWDNGWVASILAVSLLGAVVVLSTLAIYQLKHQAHVIRSADRCLSTAILTAMFFGLATVPVILAKPSDAICTSAAIFATLWSLLTVTAVFMKTNRVARILETSSLAQLMSRWHRISMGTPVQLAGILVLTLIGELVVFIGVIVDTPRASDRIVSREKVELVCRWPQQWQAAFTGYFLLVVATSTVVAFRTRKLPDNFNEAKFVFMGSFACCVVWIGLAPAYFLNEGVLRPVILALTVTSQMWGLWVCLFLPRLYQLIINRGVPSRTQRLRTLRSLSVRAKGQMSVSALSDYEGSQMRYNAGTAASECSFSEAWPQSRKISEASADALDTVSFADKKPTAESESTTGVNENVADQVTSTESGELVVRQVNSRKISGNSVDRVFNPGLDTVTETQVIDSDHDGEEEWEKQDR